MLYGFHPDTSLSAILPSRNLDSNLLENIDILTDIRKNVPTLLAKAQARDKKRYDSDRHEIFFKPGDLVMVSLTKRNSKLDPLFKGPFKIISKEQLDNYIVEIPIRGTLSNELIHVSRLKPYSSHSPIVTSAPKNSDVEIDDKPVINRPITRAFAKETSV